MIITLDGPAGSGKSTVSRVLAKRLGFNYLDTGALYRVVSLYALQNGIALDNGAALGALTRRLTIEFAPALSPQGEQRVLACLDSEPTFKDVSLEIRRPEIDAIVSQVSAHEEVRSALLDLQRDFAARSNVVAEGRDLGSVVFPQAELKVYLFASVEARAKRRFIQNQERFVAQAKGADDKGEAQVEPQTLEEITAAIEARDSYDSKRKVAPLRIPEGASMLDSSNLTPEETLDRLVELAREHGWKESMGLSQEDGAKEAISPSTATPTTPRAPRKKEVHPLERFYSSPTSEHPLYARFFFGLVYVILWLGTKIWTRWSIEGLENLESLPEGQGAVIVANHSHALDPAFIQAARPRRRRVRYIYKSEFDKSPVLSKMLAWLGAFPVKRHTADRKALKRAEKALRAGEDVGIFPEGTRIPGRAGRGKIHGGFALIAHMAQAPIVPIAIEGAWRLPKPCKLRLKVGKPLFMSDYEHLDRKERIAALEHDAMEQVFSMRDQLDKRNADYEGSYSR